MSTGSQISDDIARQNFVRVGRGEGREELEARLADIQKDRRRSYGGEGGEGGEGAEDPADG